MEYTKDNPLRVFTAFSGIESQLLALERLKRNFPPFDYVCVGWSEIDPHAIKAHDALFPDLAGKNYGDICKIDWEKVPDFDLFTYSSPCFVAGTKIRTREGQKAIEDVAKGDMVLTHTGAYKAVTETMSREYRGPLAVVSTSLPGEITCTPNHPFWARMELPDGTSLAPEWVDAETLTKKHSLFMPSVKAWVAVKYVRLYADECMVYNLEVEDDHSYTALDFAVHNCQDFSTAGLRRGGQEGSGTRSSLLWECRKAILAKKPKYTLFENVKGLLTEKMRPYFDKWLAELDRYGYTSFAKVLNAKDYQIPQNRERIFVFSVLDCDAPYYFPKAMPQTRCLRDVLEPEPVDERYYLSEKVLATFKRRNEEHAAKGNGFRFEPTDGGGMAKTLAAGIERQTDNFLIVNGMQLQQD